MLTEGREKVALEVNDQPARWAVQWAVSWATRSGMELETHRVMNSHIQYIRKDACVTIRHSTSSAYPTKNDRGNFRRHIIIY